MLTRTYKLLNHYIQNAINIYIYIYIYIYIFFERIQNEKWVVWECDRYQTPIIRICETNYKWTAMVTYLDSGIEVNQWSPWKLHSFTQCFEEELVDKTVCFLLFKLYDKHLEMKNVTASKKSFQIKQEI